MKQSGAFDCPIYLDNISCKRSNLGSRFHLAKKKAAGIVLRTPFAGATQVFHHLEPGKPYGAMASSPCPARLFTLIAASRRRGALHQRDQSGDAKFRARAGGQARPAHRL